MAATPASARKQGSAFTLAVEVGLAGDLDVRNLVPTRCCSPSGKFIGIFKEQGGPHGAGQLRQAGWREAGGAARGGAGDAKDAPCTWWDNPCSTPTKTKLVRFQGKNRIARRLIGGDAHLGNPERSRTDLSAQDLCHKAASVLRKGDAKRARKLLEKAVSADPACVKAWCNLGLLLQSWYKDVAGATSHYEQALALDPRHADTLCNYGFLHLTMGAQSASRAEDLFKRCLEVDATHIDALCNYGLLKHQVAHDFAKAEDLFRKALALNPSHVQALFNLANLMRESNRIPEAIELYQHVIAIEPSNVDCMCNLGTLEQRVRKNKAVAQHYFQQCLAINPRHVGALANYASLEFEQNNPTAAQDLYFRCLREDPNNFASLMGLALLFKDTDPKRARQYCQDALALQPNHAWLLHLKSSLGETNLASGASSVCSSSSTQPHSGSSTMMHGTSETANFDVDLNSSTNKSQFQYVVPNRFRTTAAQRQQELEALSLLGPAGTALASSASQTDAARSEGVYDVRANFGCLNLNLDGRKGRDGAGAGCQEAEIYTDVIHSTSLSEDEAEDLEWIGGEC